MRDSASSISYVKGIHNLKAGATYQQTFLTENDNLGIVDPTFLPSLSDANGNPCYDTATNQCCRLLRVRICCRMT